MKRVTFNSHRKPYGRSESGGYLLAITIVLGFVISSFGVFALQTLAQNSLTLNSKYYNTLANEAAQAGMAAARDCIAAGVSDWGAPNDLQPQTDCHGSTVAGKQTTVENDGSIQTYYD